VGTVTITMLRLQNEEVAVTVPNFTTPELPKRCPAIATLVPTVPCLGAINRILATVVGGTAVGAMVVGGTVVGGTVVGAMVVGGTVVGAMVVGGTVVGAMVVGGVVVVVPLTVIEKVVEPDRPVSRFPLLAHTV
jgi:hypothetical protein